MRNSVLDSSLIAKRLAVLRGRLDSAKEEVKESAVTAAACTGEQRAVPGPGRNFEAGCEGMFAQRLAVLKQKRLRAKSGEEVLLESGREGTNETPEEVTQCHTQRDNPSRDEDVLALQAQLARSEATAALEDIIRQIELQQRADGKRALRRLVLRRFGELELAFEGWQRLGAQQPQSIQDSTPGISPDDLRAEAMESQTERTAKRSLQAQTFAGWNNWKEKMAEQRRVRLVSIRVSLRQQRQVVSAIWVAWEAATSLHKVRGGAGGGEGRGGGGGGNISSLLFHAKIELKFPGFGVVSDQRQGRWAAIITLLSNLNFKIPSGGGEGEKQIVSESKSTIGQFSGTRSSGTSGTRSCTHCCAGTCKEKGKWEKQPNSRLRYSQFVCNV